MSTGLIIALVVCVPLIILGLVMRTGRGAFLIAGYNTMSEKERASWNKDALCKSIGNCLIISSILAFMIIYASSLEFIKPWMVWGSIIAYLVGIVLWLVHINKSERFKSR